jgi:hypothetical protein
VQSIFCQLACLKKGIPFRLLKIYWIIDIIIGEVFKRSPIITNGKLYRRSKKHTHFTDHWNDARLGEISCNYSKFSKNPADVFFNSENNKPLKFEGFNRILICNLDHFTDDESFPLVQTLIQPGEGELKIEVSHFPLDCNYSHCNINCYLTTEDQNYINKKVPFESWDQHPLKRKLKGLKGKYKTHLYYHFQPEANY